MERNVARRFTGPRALAAEGMFFIAGIAAACNPSTATETPKPTILPSEKPTPTITLAPTPEATPTPEITPSPEPTPIPTPEATPMPVINLFEGEHPKIAVKTVASDIKTTLEKTPEALSDGGTIDGYLTAWTYCQKGDPIISGDLYENKQLNCQNLIFAFYQHYQNLKNESFYKLADEVYDYAANNLPDRYLTNLQDNLKAFFP